jgi:hypothetical protein
MKGRKDDDIPKVLKSRHSLLVLVGAQGYRPPDMHRDVMISSYWSFFTLERGINSALYNNDLGY